MITALPEYGKGGVLFKAYDAVDAYDELIDTEDVLAYAAFKAYDEVYGINVLKSILIILPSPLYNFKLGLVKLPLTNVLSLPWNAPKGVWSKNLALVLILFPPAPLLVFGDVSASSNVWEVSNENINLVLSGNLFNEFKLLFIVSGII